MSNQLFQEEGIEKRIRTIILSRVAIVTFLLGITTVVKIQRAEILPELSITLFYIIFALTYVLSIVYLLLLKFIKNTKLNIYVQTLCDVVLITCLVYITGGIGSIYSVFYPLVIIYSVLFLKKGGGLIIASASSIFYGLLIDLEYYNIIHPIYVYGMAVHDYDSGAGYVFTRIFIHILSFYIIAFLASFVVEQERKARILLAEKETAFDQLDLLHRSIIESIDTGIMTINLQGKIKSFNRAAEEISGLTFAEVENKTIYETFPNFLHIKEAITQEDYTNSKKNRYNLEFKNRENKNLILGCSVSILKDNKGKQIGDILIFQDLTSIRKMEENLEKNKRLAIIGEMAAGLAHEMRNPLASISGSIQVLRKDIKHSTVDDRLMQIILRGKDQLENIIKDFLLLARPIQGNQQTVAVREIIEDVVESVQYVPDWNENITVSLSLSDNLSIYANRAEIREIVWNLILNSVQAMPEGGVLSIETKKYVSDDKTKEYLEMRISDTGYGIDEKYLNKIFEPFFTTKERGTGLGLTIVNKIIEAYAGTIRIESTIESGTTFSILLPLG